MTTVTLGHHRVVRPPGPSYGPLGSIRAMRRLQPTGFLESVHRDHPRIAYVRFGSENAYLVFEPDLVRSLLVDAGRATSKGRGLQRAKELLGESLLTSEGDLHHRQRRLVQPAFHASRIAGYAEIMCEETRRLSGGWRPGACIGMSAEMSELTLRIVGRALFGTELTPADIGVVSQSLSTFLMNFERLMLPFAELLGRLPTKRNRQLAQAREDLDRLVYRLIAEHREAGDIGDLLSMLLLVRDGDQGSGMSDEQVRDEALTLLLAGHETTANALTWTWLQLAQNRPVAAQLHREVDRLGRQPVPADLDALPFTRAVIAESMRLYPPAWIVGRRAIEPLTMDGYTVPAGSLVATSQWIVHRDPRWWGDAEAFRPDRWMTADGRFDDAAPGAPRGAYFPFGAGRRVCIGESFAWTEAVLVLATLAQVWAPELLPETGMATRPAVTLRPADGAPLRLRYRR